MCVRVLAVVAVAAVAVLMVLIVVVVLAKALCSPCSIRANLTHREECPWVEECTIGDHLYWHDLLHGVEKLKMMRKTKALRALRQ